MSSEEKVADQKSQNRVTEELELFVVSLSRAPLVRVRGMRYRLPQQLDVLEGISEIGFKIVNRTHKCKVGKRRNSGNGCVSTAIRFQGPSGEFRYLRNRPGITRLTNLYSTTQSSARYWPIFA